MSISLFLELPSSKVPGIRTVFWGCWQEWAAGGNSLRHLADNVHVPIGTVAHLCKESIPLLFRFENTPHLFCSSSGWSSGSDFSVLLHSYFWSFFLVLVHDEASELNPRKEIRGERSQCKGLRFPELCMWLLVLEVIYLECVCRGHGLNCLSVSVSCWFWTQLSGLCTIEAGMGRSQWVIVEGVGLCYRILGRLLASFWLAVGKGAYLNNFANRSGVNRLFWFKRRTLNRSIFCVWCSLIDVFSC